MWTRCLLTSLLAGLLLAGVMGCAASERGKKDGKDDKKHTDKKEEKKGGGPSKGDETKHGRDIGR